MIMGIDGSAEFVIGVGDGFDDVEEACVQSVMLFNRNSSENSACTDMKGSKNRETGDFRLFLVYSHAA
ncbi:hypothetical protein ACFLS0_01490 [Candidatus Bipolaricaulota bacterium]